MVGREEVPHNQKCGIHAATGKLHHSDVFNAWTTVKVIIEPILFQL